MVKLLSAHMVIILKRHHVCYLCYASNCNTLVTLSSISSKMQVWAACPLSHNSLEEEGRKLPYITIPVRQFLMAAAASWPDRVWHMLQWRVTGRQTQRNIRGALALKQSIVKGNPALLMMTHSDGPHWIKCSVVLLFHQQAALYHSFLLIDDTKRCPHFHLYSSSAVIFFLRLCLLLPSPNNPSSLPPTSLPISHTSESFFLLSREMSAA